MHSTAFVQGWLMTAGLIVAIGAQNALVLRQGLMRQHVAPVVLLCTASDWLLIGLGVFGLGALIQSSQTLLQLFRYGGVAFLLAYGARAAWRAWRGTSSLAQAAKAPSSLSSTLLTALALTYLNPHVYLDTVVLLGGVGAQHGPSGRYAFAAGAGLASLMWFCVLGYRVVGGTLVAPNLGVAGGRRHRGLGDVRCGRSVVDRRAVMQVIVLGAGILGVSTAWYLLEQGHEVTVIDRQPDAALETSFANGAQISVSYCEPWAHPSAALKVLKWLAHDDSPLLFRPRMDPHQWRWGLHFLGQCTPAAFERNVSQLVALGRYSHSSLKDLVAQTGITYDRLERGILHFFCHAPDLEAARVGVATMRRHGVDRRILTRDEVLRVEPALEAFAARIVGGTYTASDESGDARVFTQRLAQLCAQRGARFLYQQEITGFVMTGGRLQGVQVRDTLRGTRSTQVADAYVAALGSHTAPMLRPLGVTLHIYPAKGYSATLRLLQPECASVVSMIDDTRKIAISRLGDFARVAGTAEMAGYDVGIDSARSRLRCEALVKRYEEIFPGVADTRTPQFWAGLRPSTPNNVPYIGRTRVDKLWVNAGHGTLGWTHGAGSGRALAELMSGRVPDLDFAFC